MIPHAQRNGNGACINSWKNSCLNEVRMLRVILWLFECRSFEIKYPLATHLTSLNFYFCNKIFPYSCNNRYVLVLFLVFYIFRRSFWWYIIPHAQCKSNSAGINSWNNWSLHEVRMPRVIHWLFESRSFEIKYPLATYFTSVAQFSFRMKMFFSAFNIIA